MVNTHVLPEIFNMHDDCKAEVTLCKDLLLACFVSEAEELVPLKILRKVQNVYEVVRKLDPTVNPLHKIPILISGHVGQLIIEELFGVYSETVGVGTATKQENNSSPTTSNVLNRMQSRNSSEIQIVFAQ